jgi:SET domain-containing protein
MKERLFLNNKIEIRKSEIEGYGVFAKENIKKGELIEECRYAIITPPILGAIISYHYEWPKIHEKVTIDKETLRKVNPEFTYLLDNNLPFQLKAIVFGFASMYNSHMCDSPHVRDSELTHNVDWYTDMVNDIYIFEAIEDIKKDEELYIKYSLKTLG